MMQISRRRFLCGAAIIPAVLAPSTTLAALFSGVASGGGGGITLTTLTLKTKDGSNIAANQFFEFGLPIAAGQMAQSYKVTLTDASSNALTVQEDNRVVDADGYVRWIKITAILPTAPGASSTAITIAITTGSPDTSNPITIANLLAQTISGDTAEVQNQITLPNGDVYTAKLTDGLNASTTWTYGSAYNEGVWRQGPLCTEFVAYVPYVRSGTPHPYLYCAFQVSAYKKTNAAWNNSTNPITGVKAYCFNENGFNATSAGWSATPQDYVYDWSIKTGASTLATALSLTGAAGVGNLALSATNGDLVTCDRTAGSWATSTSAPNSSDSGKAIVEIGGTGLGYITEYTDAGRVYLTVSPTTPFSGTSIAAANWKKMGVYHCWGTRVSNTNPAMGGSWWGTNHDLVYPILSTAYIKASGMVPNYRLTSSSVAAPDLTFCDRDGAHPCGASFASGYVKNYWRQEESGSDVDNIGVYTAQQVNSLAWWGDATQHANARKQLIANAEVGHRKALFFRNEEYGSINTIADYGCYTTNGGRQIPLNGFTGGNSPFHLAGNHSGQVSQLPYILTGDLYHLQNQFILAGSYPLSATDYGIFDMTSTAVTISGSTLTGPGTMPTQTGEPVQVANTDGYSMPSIGGVPISTANRYYYHIITSNTGSLYDTLAHALAGGATGLITFSSSWPGVFLGNAYTKNGWPPGVHATQTRAVAWCARSIGHPVAIAPTSPVSPNVIYCNYSKAQALRLTTAMFNDFNTRYTTDPNFVAGGPRFLDIHYGNDNGLWQQGYVHQVLVDLIDAGLQSEGGNLALFLDWFLACVIQWHIESSIYVPNHSSSYYFTVAADIIQQGGSASAYTYSGIQKIALGVPFARTDTPVTWGFWSPSNLTCTVGSIADLANVPITISGAWFDTAVKADYEGIAWFGVPGAIGRIKTISSATQIVVDFTVTTAYGANVNNGTPTTGAGQGFQSPLPTGGMAANVFSTDKNYGQNHGLDGAGYDHTVAMLDRSSLEIAKQRGINVGAANANYNAAVSDMTGRNFPTSWANAGGSDLKFNLVAR